MVSFLIGLAVLAILLYTALIYISESIMLLTAAYAVLFFSAQVVLFLRVRSLHVTLEAPVAAAERGKSVRIRLKAEKKGILPLQRWSVKLVTLNTFLQKKQIRRLGGSTLLPGLNVLSDSIQLRDYGNYEIALRRIRIYDLTGLFYRNIRLKSTCSVLVLPDFEWVGIRLTENTKSFFGEAEQYDEDRSGPDQTETFQIRPFQDGDKLQSIHWKLSAKMDDLVVKEDSLPKSCPVVLFLECHGGSKRRRVEKNAYLGVLASISFQLMDMGCPHYVAWNGSKDADPVRVRVEDDESLYLMLREFMEQRFTGKSGELSEDYRQKYRGDNYLHALCLNESLELSRDGERLTTISGKHWKEELQGLEILL